VSGCFNLAVASRAGRGYTNAPFRELGPHGERVVKDPPKNHFVPGYSMELPNDIPDRVSS
jgi:hypothetical protein